MIRIIATKLMSNYSYCTARHAVCFVDGFIFLEIDTFEYVHLYAFCMCVCMYLCTSAMNKFTFYSGLSKFYKECFAPLLARIEPGASSTAAGQS